jgi:hypothetical protein
LADAFPVSGSIDPQTFPFVVLEFHRRGATGSLKVEGPTHHKAIYFRGGRMLFASSNDPKDQLGAILIESGKLTPEQLEDVNTKVGPGNPLAKVLSESGFVNNRELSEAARAKVERILSNVIAYEGGSFEFEDGVLPKGAVDLKLPTEKVALAAVRRISDRGFVLRHIDDLEIVLTPNPAAAERLGDLRIEAGGLADHLDSALTLKEAAAAARLDEFDAAKIACALLFLGLVERATHEQGSQEAEPASDLPTAGDELDLSQTARVAFTEVDDPGPMTASIPMGEPEPQPLFEPSSLTHSEPEPQLFTTPAGERQEELPPTRDDAAREPESFSPADYSPSWSPRPNYPETDLEREATPLTDTSSASANPPSREDLAALDTLMNARSVEGPLMPLDKPPAKDGGWEPRFASQEPAQSHGGGHGRAILLGIGALLAMGALAIAWLNGSGTTAPTTTAATDVSPATPATTLTTPTPVPMEPASTLPSAAALPSTPPTTVRPPTPAVPRVTPGVGGINEPKPSLAASRTLLQKGQFSEAARGFAANLKGATKSAYSLQLLVACSEETLQKAVSNVAAQELFIVPVQYKGHACYRVCWGMYDSEGRARSAVHAVPDYFRKGGARPKTVATAVILP